MEEEKHMVVCGGVLLIGGTANVMEMTRVLFDHDQSHREYTGIGGGARNLRKDSRKGTSNSGVKQVNIQ